MPFIVVIPLILSLERRSAGFAGADAHGVLDAQHEDLAVPDLAGGRRGLDRLHRRRSGRVVDHRLQLDLGHEIDLVLRASVDFGLALLSAVSLDLRDRQPLDAGLDERFAHVVQLEGFDDRNDEFHPPRSRSPTVAGPAPRMVAATRVAARPRGDGSCSRRSTRERYRGRPRYEAAGASREGDFGRSPVPWAHAARGA